jgi:thiazole synthase
MTVALEIGGKKLASRLFLGTGKFSSAAVMREAVAASASELVTVALKRVNVRAEIDSMIEHLNLPGVNLLPNTSGVRTAKEAVLAAHLAREALETNWLKLEIHPDPQYLLPDPIETLLACEELAKDGFIILPYVNADPVLCKRLEEAGAAAVMPLGAPIGSNQGLQTKAMLEIIIAQSNVPVVIDAGLGAPSHAAAALEMGAAAVLVNTAIAVAGDPVEMARAFREATVAGQRAREASLARPEVRAVASSPLTAFLD